MSPEENHPRRNAGAIAVATTFAAIAVVTHAAPASAQQATQAAVVRFETTPAAPPAARVRVAATLTPLAGAARRWALGEAGEPCRGDEGGLDSLAVFNCGRRWFELVHDRAGVWVETNEWLDDAHTRRRRVRRQLLFRPTRGWVVVPWCRERADNPRACPPA